MIDRHLQDSYFNSLWGGCVGAGEDRIVAQGNIVTQDQQRQFEGECITAVVTCFNSRRDDIEYAPVPYWDYDCDRQWHGI